MLFKCPNCYEYIEIPEEHYKRSVSCPYCQYRFYEMEYYKCEICNQYVLYMYKDQHKCTLFGNTHEKEIRLINKQKENFTKKKIIEIINEIGKLNITEDQIYINLQDLGLDSVGYINCILGIEKTYGMQFTSEYLSFEKINTVEKIIKAVEAIMEN